MNNLEGMVSIDYDPIVDLMEQKSVKAIPMDESTILGYIRKW
jgi:hypothetical protein